MSWCLIFPWSPAPLCSEIDLSSGSSSIGVTGQGDDDDGEDDCEDEGGEYDGEEGGAEDGNELWKEFCVIVWDGYPLGLPEVKEAEMIIDSIEYASSVMSLLCVSLWTFS
jgi:hypothetical protein